MQFEILDLPLWQPEIPILPLDEQPDLQNIRLPTWIEEEGDMRMSMFAMPIRKDGFAVYVSNQH